MLRVEKNAPTFSSGYAYNGLDRRVYILLHIMFELKL